jgi:hypothetical protein
MGKMNKIKGLLFDIGGVLFKDIKFNFVPYLCRDDGIPTYKT